MQGDFPPGAPVSVHLKSKFCDDAGPGHRAGTPVSVMDAASWPSKRDSIDCRSYQPHEGSPLPTAMPSLPATLLSEGQDGGDVEGKRRRDTCNWSVSRRG